MPARVLIVDDEPDVRPLLAEYLLGNELTPNFPPQRTGARVARPPAAERERWQRTSSTGRRNA
jgi:hypothetical protein